MDFWNCSLELSAMPDSSVDVAHFAHLGHDWWFVVDPHLETERKDRWPVRLIVTTESGPYSIGSDIPLFAIVALLILLTLVLFPVGLNIGFNRIGESLGFLPDNLFSGV